MPDLTSVYGFKLPIVGGDVTVWGGFLNDNWEANEVILVDFEARITANTTAIADLDTDLQTQINDLQVIVSALSAETENLKIKVGDLYISADAADPATKLGYGTWVAFGGGRALVGVGSTGGFSIAAEENKGAHEASLTVAQLPRHTHSIARNIDVGGSPGTSLTGMIGRQRDNQGDNSYALHGMYSPSITSVSNVGSTSDGWDQGLNGNPVSRVQPSIGIYVWKRTA